MDILGFVFITAIIALIGLQSILLYEYISLFRQSPIEQLGCFPLFCDCKKPYFEHPDTIAVSICLIILLELIPIMGSVGVKAQMFQM